MATYIALLRGINLGARRVKNAALQAAVASLGYADVRLYLASGNVIFASRSSKTAQFERDIEQKVRETFGFDSETFVRTPAQMAAAAALHPFGADITGKRLYINFCKGPPTAAQREAIMALASADDLFHVEGSEVYWHPAPGMHASKSATKVLRILAPVTNRNQNTVAALGEY